LTRLLYLLAAIALLVWGTHLVQKDTLRVLDVPQPITKTSWT